jgi:hypothetical protein
MYRSITGVLSLTAVSLVVSVLSTGCCELFGNCGSSGGSGSNVPTGEIVVQSYNNGLLQGVDNAIVSGYTIPGNYNCDTITDPNCITSFSNGYTNTNGDFTFSTDALPGTWDIAVGNANGCSGADTGWVNWSPSIPLDVVCGSYAAVNVSVSPSGCLTTEYSNKPPTTNCPSTVTLTVNQPPMSTSRNMTVAAYDESANELAQSSITPTSSTQITAPLPNAPGKYIIFLIADPTTQQIIGGARFEWAIRDEIRP